MLVESTKSATNFWCFLREEDGVAHPFADLGCVVNLGEARFGTSLVTSFIIQPLLFGHFYFASEGKAK